MPLTHTDKKWVGRRGLDGHNGYNLFADSPYLNHLIVKIKTYFICFYRCFLEL